MTQEMCKRNVQADVFHYIDAEQKGAVQVVCALLHSGKKKKDPALHCLCSTLMSALIGFSFF